MGHIGANTVAVIARKHQQSWDAENLRTKSTEGAEIACMTTV